MNHSTNLCLVAMLLAVSLAGCQEKTIIPTVSGSEEATRHDEALFSYAVENLNRLSEFNPDEILGQIVDRLNQWARSDTSTVPWQPDDLIATLPNTLQTPGLMRDLSTSQFRPYDGAFLREVVMMRDISRHVCGGVYDDLAKARLLFQWTVNNINIDPEPTSVEPIRGQMPWQTTVFGHGRAVERAWVFMVLARQQNLDVVLLTVPSDKQPGGYRIWCTALVRGDSLFLFDHVYGVAIPSSNDGGVATLAEVAKDDALLRQLDLEGTPYPFGAKDAQKVNVYIEAGRQFLSRRMKKVELRLSGTNRMVLTTQPSMLAARLEKLPHVDSIRMWPLPFEFEQLFFKGSPSQQAIGAQMRLFSPFMVGRANPLWRARLKHFEGRFESLDIAATARAKSRKTVEEQRTVSREGAKQLYLSARSIIGMLDDQEMKDDERVEWREFSDAMRQAATFWLGMISADEKNYELAKYYFQECQKNWPKGDKNWPLGQWQSQVNLQLAHTLQSLGEKEKAIEHYRRVAYPANLGARLRLRKLGANAATTDKQKPVEEKSEQGTAEQEKSEQGTADGERRDGENPDQDLPDGNKPADAESEDVKPADAKPDEGQPGA